MRVSSLELTISDSILVVDDNDDGRELLCELLTREGFAVTEAGNGQQALDLLLCEEGLPSLILLD